MARVWLLLVLAAALQPSVGCKGKDRDVPAAVRPAARVAVPEEVLSWVGVRSPERTVDGLLALLGRFTRLPVNRGELLDLLLQQGRLPRDLLEALDTGGTFWFVGLSQERLAEKHPAVVVLPVRSVKRFTAALERRMSRTRSKGEVVVYRPRPGTVGVAEVRLAFAGRHAVVVSSDRAHEVTRRFVVANLLAARLDHDVELHVSIANLARSKQLSGRADQVIARLRQRMQQRQQPEELIELTQRTLRGQLEILRSARELLLTGDISAEGLTLALRAVARDSGRLAEVVARQRPGQPLGAELLPGDSWLLVADRSNPGARNESGLIGSSFAAALERRKRELDPSLRSQLEAALQALSGALSGDFTVAAHPPPIGGHGLTISAVVGLTATGQPAGSAIEAAGDALGAWLREEGRGTDAPAIEQTRFEHAGAAGWIYRLSIPQRAADQGRTSRLLGSRPTLGWAASRDRLLVAFGQGAATQLQRMCARAAAGQGATGKGLGDSPALARELAARGGVGLVAISIVDLLRTLAAAGVEELAPFGVDLKQVQVRAAPTLAWGVDRPGVAPDSNGALQLSLRLPASHFGHFKPFLEQLTGKRPALPLGGIRP